MVDKSVLFGPSDPASFQICSVVRVRIPTRLQVPLDHLHSDHESAFSPLNDLCSRFASLPDPPATDIRSHTQGQAFCRTGSAVEVDSLSNTQRATQTITTKPIETQGNRTPEPKTQNKTHTRRPNRLAVKHPALKRISYKPLSKRDPKGNLTQNSPTPDQNKLT